MKELSKELSVDERVLAQVKSRYQQAKNAGAAAAVQKVSEGDFWCWSDFEEFATDVLVEHGFPASMALMIRCRPQELDEEALLRFISGCTAVPEDCESEEYDLALQFHDMFIEDMMDEMEKLGVSKRQFAALLRLRVMGHYWLSDPDVAVARVLEEIRQSIAAASKARVEPT